jgi:hypothetical protein
LTWSFQERWTLSHQDEILPWFAAAVLLSASAWASAVVRACLASC